MYSAWRANPDDVAPHWRDLFESIEAGRPLPTRLPNGGAMPGGNGRPAPAAPTGASRQGAVVRLIQLYRLRGYRAARVDPLQLNPNLRSQAPKLEYAGLSEADLETVFDTGRFGGAEGRQLPLRTIVEQLEQIYCGDIGVEMAHVSRARERLWLRDRVEAAKLAGRPPAPVKRAILRELIAAEGLERYLHTRYVGQKRFSLEGGDSLIPMLYDLIQQAGAKGLQEIVIGMAHRGRINVLVNVLGKAPQELYAEFAGEAEPLSGKYGDVKYHMGFSSDVTTPGGLVHVVLAFNPSHLEIVNPVVLGSVRARMDRRRDSEGDEILPVLIHGDAAVAGQGVVAETLQLSQARSFATGGTVHLIVNNQIGFTTSDPQDARSTPYCSDVAKMIEAPVLHVNGDSPEACIFATRLALDYRQAFHKDVFVDLVCYRRHGHNEADEPAATQPLMYERIRSHPTTLEMYADRLCGNGVITKAELKADKADYRKRLEEGDPLPEATLGMVGNEFTVDWDSYRQADPNEKVDTAISPASVKELGERLGAVPESVNLNARVEKVVADRLRMARGEIDMDWGFAELMAYGSLLKDGFRVRLTGQDSRRGTFFHRHASLIDQHSGRAYSPLDDVAPMRGAFTITDSLLSEEAVMGFEYGYSTTDPDCLTIWEGQFGRFLQRRPGRDRPVHRLGRHQVGPHVRPGAFSPARPGRRRTGTFIGPARTVPAVVRAGEHAGVRAVNAGPDVPYAAPADAQQGAGAAGGAHAQEPASQQAVVHAALGAERGPFRPDHWGGGRARQSAARGAVQRETVFRSAGGAPRRGRTGRGAGSHRAALPVSARTLPGTVRALRGRGGHCLGAGRTEEPGRLVPGAGAAGALAGQWPALALHGTRRSGLSGSRFHTIAPSAAIRHRRTSTRK